MSRLTEVGKAKHLKAQAERDVDAVAEERDRMIEADAGEVGEVVVQSVGTLDDSGYGESDPHQRILEKGVEHTRAGVVFLEHGNG